MALTLMKGSEAVAEAAIRVLENKNLCARHLAAYIRMMSEAPRV